MHLFQNFDKIYFMVYAVLAFYQHTAKSKAFLHFQLVYVYASNIEKVEGAYCFGLVRACVWARACVFGFEISLIDSSSKNKKK